jgi:hypothetical protein
VGHGVRGTRDAHRGVPGAAGPLAQGATLLGALRARSLGQLAAGVVLRRSGATRTSATTPSTASGLRAGILFAKAAQASAWFDPELLAIPLRREVDGR